MNQNTTIETIREAIEVLYKGDIDDRPKNTVLALFGGYEWVTNDEGQPYRTFGTGGSPKFWLDAHEYELLRTICLANRLEAAPQPPVEQSEPEHPLFVGRMWGREIRCDDSQKGKAWCPFHDDDCCNCDCTLDRFVWHGQTLWLAPPAVIEPEPELDEFEMWAKGDGAAYFSDDDARDFALEKYREIISRKGDK